MKEVNLIVAVNARNKKKILIIYSLSNKIDLIIRLIFKAIKDIKVYGILVSFHLYMVLWRYFGIQGICVRIHEITLSLIM